MVKAFAKQISNNPSLESVITKKIFSVDVNDSVYNAIDIMNNRNVGSVIVVESNTDSSSSKNTPYGIFTERDLLTKVLSKNVSLNEKIKDYCSTELITADVGIRAIEAANIMMASKIKRLPLTELPSTVAKEDSMNGKKKKKKNISAIVTARDLVDVFQS
ncbi:MAG TPA: CBS domain-containing protein, partial [Nitrososphaeraceae archaeon]|nr:CBS domain-containing protein [Nitrososphaeraceae archaeon]